MPSSVESNYYTVCRGSVDAITEVQHLTLEARLCVGKETDGESLR